MSLRNVSNPLRDNKLSDQTIWIDTRFKITLIHVRFEDIASIFRAEAALKIETECFSEMVAPIETPKFRQTALSALLQICFVRNSRLRHPPHPKELNHQHRQ